MDRGPFVAVTQKNNLWIRIRMVSRAYILTLLWDISFGLLKSNVIYKQWVLFMKFSRTSNVIFSMLYQKPFHISMDYGQSYPVNAIRTWKLKYRLKSSLIWIAIPFWPHCNQNMRANSHAKTLNSIAILIANASLSITLNRWVICVTRSTMCRILNCNQIF